MTDRRNGGEARDRDGGEPVKVLVAGGTGVTGRLVRGMLGVVDGIELAYTSRQKPDDGPGRHFPLRIAAGHNEICRVFRKHDWVVNCTGPFEVHADSLARACIDSGTGYIDVNDSIDARRAIMALDGDARREGVPVLTGFGLCPGLSTALLMLGARAAGAEEVRDVRVDLRIGADQESGAASVESMFRTIRGGYRAMLGGAIVEVRRNPVSSQSGIGYECPDIDVVREVCPSILGYSYHVAFDALPDESVEKIRTSRLYAMPVVSGLLARLGAAVTSRKARAKGTPQPAELVVALSSAGAGDAGSAAETTVVRATGPGSYKMTAAIASATVLAVAGKPVVPGCRDLVGHPRLLEPVLAFARDAGIHIETPHDDLTTGPLPAVAHCDTEEKGKR